MEEKKQLEEQKKTVTIELSEYERLQAENVKLRVNMNNAMQQMQGMHDALVEKRIDFLFRVLENHIQFDEEFVGKCVKELQEVLMPVEEEKKDGK